MIKKGRQTHMKILNSINVRMIAYTYDNQKDWSRGPRILMEWFLDFNEARPRRGWKKLNHKHELCYVPWLCNIAMENGPCLEDLWWFTCPKWWFSIATLNRQTVSLVWKRTSAIFGKRSCCNRLSLGVSSWTKKVRLDQEPKWCHATSLKRWK